MDYCAVFRPIFSFVAHFMATAAVERPDRRQASAAARELKNILTSAQKACRAANDPHQKDAWLAVIAWLAEMMERRPEGKHLLAHGVTLPEAPGREFYPRLNRLLNAGDAGDAGADRREAIRLHALCLDLGFHGSPMHRAHRDAYRRRCRLALGSRAGGPESGSPPREAAPGPTLAAVAWRCLPPVFAIVLYIVYRLLLIRLYDNVLG